MVLWMGGKTSTASKRKWNNENYEYTQLVTQKGEKERIKQAAKQAGQSVNAYVWKLYAAVWSKNRCSVRQTPRG